MPEDEDNAITYETFRKFHRREKKNEKLQDLPDDFFRSCVDWINKKKGEFEENNDSSLLREIENVKNLVKDIFDRRRKKILLLALHSVRSKKVSQNLLPEEKDFFENTIENLKALEENLLHKVLEGKEPAGGDEGKEEKEKEEEGKGNDEEEDEGKEEKKKEKETSEEGSKVKSEKIGVETGDETKLVRVIEEVESFMGTDENEYGPLEKGDLATLPVDVAELLIEKERAEEANV